MPASRAMRASRAAAPLRPIVVYASRPCRISLDRPPTLPAWAGVIGRRAASDTGAHLGLFGWPIPQAPTVAPPVCPAEPGPARVVRLGCLGDPTWRHDAPWRALGQPRAWQHVRPTRTDFSTISRTVDSPPSRSTGRHLQHLATFASPHLGSFHARTGARWTCKSAECGKIYEAGGWRPGSGKAAGSGSIRTGTDHG